jgi:hypothetical protein
MDRYCVTFDKPHAKTAKWPGSMPGWSFLREYVQELHNPDLPAGEQQNILVEKSRDMVITITTAMYMLYCIQFVPDWSAFVTSRRENEVDDGGDKSTPDSIFGVMRWSWSKQPSWLQMPLTFSHLKIQNVEAGMHSYMTGESANPNAGRGKSVTFKYGDEFAFVPQSHKVHQSMSGGNYRTLVYGSTPNFSGNSFYDLRHKDRGFRILTYHYSMRPGRDAAWAQRTQQRKGMSDLEWATEYEIKYDFTSSRSVYPRYMPGAHIIPAETAPIDGEPFLAFDDGFAQPGAMYFCRKADGRLYIIDETYERGLHVRVPDEEREIGVRDWVMVATEMCERRHLEPKNVMVVMGPESTSTAGYSSTAALFRLAGFRTHVADNNKRGRIKIVDRLMIHSDGHPPRLQISDACTNLTWEIPRYERRIKDGQVTEDPKDGNDHGCDSVGCVAQFLFPDILRDDESEVVSDLSDWSTAGVLGDVDDL